MVTSPNREERAIAPDSDFNCVNAAPTGWGTTMQGSTMYYYISEIRDPNLQLAHLEYCVANANFTSYLDYLVPTINVDNSCIKVITTSTYYSHGCVLPKSCGTIFYIEMTQGWLLSPGSALCYGANIASSKQATVKIETVSFTKECDGIGVFDYYYLANNTQTGRMRFVSKNCIEALVKLPLTDAHIVNITVNSTREIHMIMNTTVSSDYMCSEWVDYPTLEEAIAAVNAWHYDINGNYICKNVNQLYIPETKDIIPGIPLQYLTAWRNAVAGRSYVHLLQDDPLSPWGNYLHSSFFDLPSNTSVIVYYVEELKISFFEMLAQSFLNIIEQAIRLIFNVIVEILGEVTAPLFSFFLQEIFSLLKSLYDILYPYIIQYHLAWVFLAHIIVYVLSRDCYMSSFTSFAVFLVVNLGLTFVVNEAINLFTQVNITS